MERQIDETNERTMRARRPPGSTFHDCNPVLVFVYGMRFLTQLMDLRNVDGQGKAINILQYQDHAKRNT